MVGVRKLREKFRGISHVVRVSVEQSVETTRVWWAARQRSWLLAGAVFQIAPGNVHRFRFGRSELSGPGCYLLIETDTQLKLLPLVMERARRAPLGRRPWKDPRWRRG